MVQTRQPRPHLATASDEPQTRIKRHLQQHPAIKGPSPGALEAWPVYRTYNDCGRRHYTPSDTFAPQALVDVGVPPVCSGSRCSTKRFARRDERCVGTTAAATSHDCRGPRRPRLLAYYSETGVSELCAGGHTHRNSKRRLKRLNCRSRVNELAFGQDGKACGRRQCSRTASGVECISLGTKQRDVRCVCTVVCVSACRRAHGLPPVFETKSRDGHPDCSKAGIICTVRAVLIASAGAIRLHRQLTLVPCVDGKGANECPRTHCEAAAASRVGCVQQVRPDQPHHTPISRRWLDCRGVQHCVAAHRLGTQRQTHRARSDAGAI